MQLSRLALSALVVLLNIAGATAATVPGCGDQSKLPPEQRLKNTVHWSTASEVDSFGYDVYRGDQEKGPFVKLGKSPILGAGTTDETHNYQYTDDSIDPCKEYWYYVESISTHGVREKFTPVNHAAAKRGPDGKPVIKAVDSAAKDAPPVKH